MWLPCFCLLQRGTTTLLLKTVEVRARKADLLLLTESELTAKRRQELLARRAVLIARKEAREAAQALPAGHCAILSDRMYRLTNLHATNAFNL